MKLGHSKKSHKVVNVTLLTSVGQSWLYFQPFSSAAQVEHALSFLQRKIRSSLPSQLVVSTLLLLFPPLLH